MDVPRGNAITVKTHRIRNFIALLITLSTASGLGWAVYERLGQTEKPGKSRKESKDLVVPVETAAVEHGPIALLRTFTGTLEPRSEFVVAPKVSGRVERLNADLADEVRRGQVLAVLDDAEFQQAVVRSRADLEVARASSAEAESLLKIAARELERIDQLRSKGVSSESQRDTARAEQLAKQAMVQVTKARIASAQADLESARIRLGYTQVSADWRGGNDKRVVAERYVDEGETVAANAPLLRIVELDPITAVFFVTERDYARLRNGQQATLGTDAFPGETFAAQVERIAPVFRESTRQARVELRVDNPNLRLKPGMFARATVMLERVEDAVIVPEQALALRDGRTGVFLLDATGKTVVWREIAAGIRQDKKVQVLTPALEGRVVTLGQQLLDDGSKITIVDTQTVRKP
ncbi:MAG: efflux RND transporter periplasmic adaptor subunit [Chromatiales bacterium]|nr:efflux RND transporter periplasmic adaptor subunit [Chromatiales bacterium]